MRRSLTAAAAVVLLTGCTGQPAAAPPTPATARTGVSQVAADSTPLRLLGGWDRARAAAYAEGSVADLRSLYTPGSAAGEADVRMLREYVDRGYRVVGIRMQILRMRVLEHDAGEWRLRVTDRLHRAVAVGHDDRLRLPRDRATTRVIRLVRARGDWKVASVRVVSGRGPRPVATRASGGRR